MNVTTDFNVIENGHTFEEGDVLERAGDPQLRALMGFEEANIAAVEEDTAACRRVDATDAVEDACLASTVGANDGKKVSGIDLEVDAGEGDHTTKVQVYILQGKQRHPCPLPFVRMLQSTALLVWRSKPLSEQAFYFSVVPESLVLRFGSVSSSR